MTTATATWPEPPLDRSIFGWDPIDDLTVLIGDWLIENCQGVQEEYLEIEAKVGRILDTHTNQRIDLPCKSETIIEMQRGWKFESNLAEQQHKRINGLLNQAVEHSKGNVLYERQNEVDLFYTSTDEFGGGGRGGSKIRVTKDSDTFRTKAVVSKRRLMDLNIFCPNRSLDYRISINLEEPKSEPQMGEESDFQRHKNRLHYTHQQICIDLTTVTSPSGDQKPSNELELEFRDAKQLLAQAQASVHAANRQEWTPFYDSILIFLNNIRMLVRNAD